MTLVSSPKVLNEFVITALGIKKDVRNTGVAIQSVDGASLVKAREPNPINNLVGKVAGLTIGASASALYGFRGKNVAILITTKRGSKDKRGFSVEVNTSPGLYAVRITCAGFCKRVSCRPIT
ncbi:TonB-dependent receptor plug [Fibrisoma limi BUZ 3]|uniref:TonB-dependent receptor plug n=1 Tax=Fibrisoma limi BUZ 3 TaxID=1185876 RepID=I2GL02_9BACT|nr:TonB-dependent receptor plug [Fibrisoma limi]CCH54578.1 TonB-dependent receptor plug [Fibrisoma limi BUZ 3]